MRMCRALVLQPGQGEARGVLPHQATCSLATCVHARTPTCVHAQTTHTLIATSARWKLSGPFTEPRLRAVAASGHKVDMASVPSPWGGSRWQTRTAASSAPGQGEAGAQSRQDIRKPRHGRWGGLCLAQDPCGGPSPQIPDQQRRDHWVFTAVPDGRCCPGTIPPSSTPFKTGVLPGSLSARVLQAPAGRGTGPSGSRPPVFQYRHHQEGHRTRLLFQGRPHGPPCL